MASNEEIGDGVIAHYDNDEHPLLALRIEVVRAALNGAEIGEGIDILLTVLTGLIGYGAMQGVVDTQAFCDNVGSRLKLTIAHDIQNRTAEQAGTQ